MNSEIFTMSFLRRWRFFIMLALCGVLLGFGIFVYGTQSGHASSGGDRNVYVRQEATEVYKLNSEGDIVWNYSFEMVPGWGYAGHSLLVDKNGYVYAPIIAEIYDFDNGQEREFESFVLKLDSNGNEVWRFKKEGDHIFDIAVRVDGYVYFTSTNYVGKLDPNGNEVWSVDIDIEWPYIDVDRYGYMYLSSWGDTFVKKFDPNGYELWSYDSGMLVAGVSVDQGENVYVLYESSVVKLDSKEFGIVWEYDTASLGTSIAVDHNGYVYATFWDNTVRKIDPSGNEVWSEEKDSLPLAISVDPEGYVYVSFWEGFALKIDSNGNEVWSVKKGFTPIGDIAVDPGLYGAGHYDKEEVFEEAPSDTFSKRCMTLGFYLPNDWFVVKILDRNGRISDVCKAEDWIVMIAGGEEDVVSGIVKGMYEVRMKIGEGGGGITVVAKITGEQTEDNYMILVSSARYNNPFPDTNRNTLGGLATSELNRMGVIDGHPDGEFKGNNPVNRAEAAKILLLGGDIDVENISTDDRFSDVTAGAWYVPYIATAANRDIIHGHPDGTFKPGETVNTAEFLKMLTLTFGLEENLPYSYNDVSKGSWYERYVGIAEKYNLFPNRSTYIDPSSRLSRYEVVTAIYQYYVNRGT